MAKKTLFDEFRDAELEYRRLVGDHRRGKAGAVEGLPAAATRIRTVAKTIWKLAVRKDEDYALTKMLRIFAEELKYPHPRIPNTTPFPPKSREAEDLYSEGVQYVRSLEVKYGEDREGGPPPE